MRRSGGDSPVIVSDALDPERLDCLFLEIGRELIADLSLQVDTSYRTIRHVYRDDRANLIWNPQGTDVIGYKNGDETYIWSLGTPKTGHTRRWAAGLRARYELPGWLRVWAAYEAAWIDSPATDLFLDDYLDGADFSWLRAGGSDWIHSLRLVMILTPYEEIGLGLTLVWDQGLATGRQKTLNTYWGGYDNLDYTRGYNRANPSDPYWSRDAVPVVLNLRLNVDLAPWTGQHMQIFFELLDAADQSPACAQIRTVATPADQLDWACGGLRAGLGMRYRL